MSLLKAWYALIFGKHIALRWDSFDNDTQILIVFLIFGAIALVILFYVVIPIIKFFYKLPINAEHRKEFLREWFSSLKPQTIKSYVSGNLPKSEKNLFIGTWIIYYFIYIVFIEGFFSLGIQSLVFIIMVGILLTGLATSWLKNNNIKSNIPNKEQKNNYKTDVEDRLSKLKDLLDRGVIDREEYEEQRKKIIEDV